MRGVVFRALASAVGADHVSDDSRERSAAAEDWSWQSKFLTYRDLPQPAPDFVVRPGSSDEVSRIVQIASDHRIPVIPRGGGSGTQGGTLAPYGGIALDMSRMNEIIEIDEESLVITCEAGVDGPTIEDALQDKGLTFAHYPGSYYMGATVGGFIAARGSGVVSTKYGKAEDQVLQVKAVLPPGRTLTTLRAPSHAAGPDLLQMMVGSEGTLGVITEVAMRVDPIPEKREFLSFTLPDIYIGMEAGRRIMT